MATVGPRGLYVSASIDELKHYSDMTYSCVQHCLHAAGRYSTLW